MCECVTTITTVMYTIINIIDAIKPEADKFIMSNDRMLYAPFLACVEKFCNENKVLIGGATGIELLLKKPVDNVLTKDMFSWELYAADAYKVAREIADAMAEVTSPHIPARTTALQTNIKHREFTIYVYTRMLLKIYSMDKYRGVDLADAAGLDTVIGPFTKLTMKSVSADMHLIQIYRNLYTPAKVSQWKDNLSTEAALYDIVKSRDTKVTGGAFHTSEFTDRIIKHIGNDAVIIGDYAVSTIATRHQKSRLQIITAEPIADIQRRIERVMGKHSNRLKVFVVNYQLNIVSDFQITKHTIYISDEKNQSPLIDIFNSSEFEMIPFWKRSGLKIGNPWVIMRFLMIDSWILKLISKFGKDPAPVLERIEKNLRTMAIVRDIALADLAACFQLDTDSYTGVYIDEVVAKKKLIKDIGDKFPTYFPAKNKQKTGSADMAMNTTHTSMAKPTTTFTYSSKPIDLEEYPEDKMTIAKKILHEPIADMLTSLTNYRNKTYSGGEPTDTIEEANSAILSGHTGNMPRSDRVTADTYGAFVRRETREQTRNGKWGANKSLDAELRKNAQFIPYIPKNINKYVDIGCGSGIVLAAFKRRFNIRDAICADVEDNRETAYKSFPFIKIEPDTSIPIPDSSVNLVTLFHVVHHMMDDVRGRVIDIARMLKPGGMLLVKDHDVRDRRDASNVDFEHFVYQIGESPNDIIQIMTQFDTELPMNYYSSEQLCDIISEYLTLVWVQDARHLTKVYSAVFKKE